MKFLDTLRLLLRLHALIQRKGTGSPDMLARRLGVSRSALFRYIKILESLDAPIAYCKYRQSYYYTETYELVFDTHTHTRILTSLRVLDVLMLKPYGVRHILLPHGSTHPNPPCEGGSLKSAAINISF